MTIQNSAWFLQFADCELTAAAAAAFLVLDLVLNNNNNNIYLLQLSCYPVAVVILHINKT
jgi:hypothetical protein